MSKLVVDQKTVYELFGNKNAYFLIPDYQRPYAWDEVECQTLWNDIFNFAIPDNDYSKFNIAMFDCESREIDRPGTYTI